MKELNCQATDAELLAAVREWAALLAGRNYEGAYDFTAHDPYYGWTPELMRAVVEGYGLPSPKRNGTIYHVTPLDSAEGNRQPRHEVERLPHPRRIQGLNEVAIGSIWFDLPLNGKWSDLTATFEVRQKQNATYLVLEEIHVF